MGLFSKLNIKWFQSKTTSDEDIINNVLVLDAKKNKLNSIKNSNFKKIKHKGLDYNGEVFTSDDLLSGSNFRFKPSEYDLNQVAAVIDIDSYLRRAVEKYVELILKNGFDFVGKNTSTVNYLRKRFEQIALVTEIPTNQLFEDIAQQLVAYSNCFISKVRNEDASGGKRRTTFYGKELKPVAGYFVEDATSMYICKDEHGKILRYKQIIKGASEYPEWKPEDMIHMYYSKKRGLSFGTPLCYPVLDDIKALRKIEQNIEILSHQHTIPIIQYIVGTKERPGEPEEVTAVRDELENSAPFGCFVTTERHKIDAVDVKINAEGMDKLVDIFKMRVYAGIGVSPLVMGDGAGTGRQTAESLDKQMENTAEKYMRVVKTFVDEFIIRELLEEGGYYYDAYDKTNRVELQFPPIDIDTKNKVEEHLNNMYQGNILTETEVRVAMARDPMTEQQRLDTHLHHVQIPLAIIKAVDETYTGPGHGTPSAKSGGTTGSTAKVVKQAISPIAQVKKIQSKIANVSQPANQHGKSLTRPRIAKDSIFREKIMNHYNATLEDLLMSLEDNTFEKAIKKSIDLSKIMIKDNYSEYMMLNYTDGYKTFNSDIQVNFNNIIRDSINQEETQLDNYFDQILEKLNKYIKIDDNDRIRNISLIQSIFNNYKSKIESFILNNSIKSYNLGIIQYCNDNKIEQLMINNENIIDISTINPYSESLIDYTEIKED